MITNLEATFALQLRASKLPPHVTEYRFHPHRQWRFDFCFPDLMIAVEIEGGTMGSRGRHVRPIGFRNDCIKYAEGALLGWMIIRGDSTMVKDGTLLGLTERAIKGVGHEAGAIRICAGCLVRAKSDVPAGVGREEKEDRAEGTCAAPGVPVAEGSSKDAGQRTSRGGSFSGKQQADDAA